MRNMEIVFKKYCCESQKINSDDEHLDAKVVFSAKINDEIQDNLESKVKLTVGGAYEEGIDEDEIRVLEVYLPDNFKKRLNYENFRNAAEKYIRSCIGSKGIAVKTEKGVKNTSLGKLEIMKNMQIDIPMSDSSVAW